MNKTASIALLVIILAVLVGIGTMWYLAQVPGAGYKALPLPVPPATLTPAPSVSAPGSPLPAALRGKLGEPVKLKIGQRVAFDTEDRLAILFADVVQDNRWCGGRLPYLSEKGIVQFAAELDHPADSAPRRLFRLDTPYLEPGGPVFQHYTFFGLSQIPGGLHEYDIKLLSLDPQNCGDADFRPLREYYEAEIVVTRRKT